ncbi:MAG: Sec-independent protein translocase protein TatB [Halomonas sp.]|uniref:Sec-independent protein translocase protein TatB n=2 Tax=Halomonadaceae TaxID=28256 RepID=A0ABS6ZKA4_9GAMM|nr:MULTISPECIES: Sec-independent protein translocase protein TatB [Halomonas]MBW6390502.1 Sec-independent protein translocase protein TatB [Halomonas antri]MDX5375910.1 Sec-independent protein translocase protein TatB [Halomonas sp.]MDX5501893.1 Sec-independent protein translocase protein TatB [Halomonas sp.]QTP57705.1 twin-arginine translocase subunit TatB [Halomonas sulfidivorans]
MFDIGFLELLIIGIVGLLVLGPERLPKAARTVGLWVGKIKRTVSSMQREINSQLEAEELRQKLKEQQTKLDESLNKAKRDVESIAETPSSSTVSPDAQSVPGQDEAQEPPKPAAARLDDALADARDTAEPDSPQDQDDKGAASR